MPLWLGLAFVTNATTRRIYPGQTPSAEAALVAATDWLPYRNPSDAVLLGRRNRLSVQLPWTP